MEFRMEWKSTVPTATLRKQAILVTTTLTVMPLTMGMKI